jgi:type IV pilus assembly protein PilE
MQGGALLEALVFILIYRVERGWGMRTMNKGFTLIEMMIVVAIIAILAAIAYPSYADYVTRGRIPEATAALSDGKVKMEQFFLDNRAYNNGTRNACTSPPIQSITARHFTITCNAPANANPPTFTLTATGIGGMTGFTYTINERNQKITVSVKSGWTLPTGNCWALKRDGGCG